MSEILEREDRGGALLGKGWWAQGSIVCNCKHRVPDLFLRRQKLSKSRGEIYKSTCPPAIYKM